MFTDFILTDLQIGWIILGLWFIAWEVLYFVWIWRDISERKRMINKIEKDRAKKNSDP
tara:strand:+ start:89 stop:262 length:174 start_codon:yes stop_codon:yes gene_type:complete